MRNNVIDRKFHYGSIELLVIFEFRNQNPILVKNFIGSKKKSLVGKGYHTICSWWVFSSYFKNWFSRTAFLHFIKPKQNLSIFNSSEFVSRSVSRCFVWAWSFLVINAVYSVNNLMFLWLLSEWSVIHAQELSYFSFRVYFILTAHSYLFSVPEVEKVLEKYL